MNRESRPSKSVRSRRVEADDMFFKEAMKQSITTTHAEEAIECSKKNSELKTYVRAKKSACLPPPSSTKHGVESRKSKVLHSRFTTPAYLLAYKDLKDEERQVRYQREQRILEQGKKRTQKGNMSLNDLFETNEQETKQTPMDDASTVMDMFDMFHWSRSSHNCVKMPNLIDCSVDEDEKESQLRGRRLRSSQEADEIHSKSLLSLKSTHTCSTRSCSLSTKRSKGKSKSGTKSQRSKSIQVANLYYVGPPRNKERKVGSPAAA